jgi:hypothetical protein
MSRLVDLIGTPVSMVPSATSDGSASDLSSAFNSINIQGMAGVLFLCVNGATIGESTTVAIAIAYSTTGNGSDASVSTTIWAASDAVVTFSTVLGLAAGSIRSIYVDVSAKGAGVTSPGYLHAWVTACEGVKASNMVIVAIPWPATRTLPIYSPTVEANCTA